jgi:hypothetical protein
MLGEATPDALGTFLGEAIRLPIQIAGLHRQPPDCRRVGEHQLLELAKAVSNFATIEVDAGFAFFQIHANTTYCRTCCRNRFRSHCWPV